MSGTSLCQDCPSDPRFTYHLSLLDFEYSDERNEDASLAPVFTGQVLSQCGHGQSSKTLNEISQYGLLGGIREINAPSIQALRADDVLEKDPRLFFNVASPSSTFICGSQGSGKSHTLSCMLEACLILSKAGRLLKPLTAVVFHYDTFICDNGGSPCEAAFLASHPNIKVRVLCAPTNIATIRGTYERFNIKVEPLQIDQADLNTKRMMDLMAVGQDNGPIPLYMHTVQRILREMRLQQQADGSFFDYSEFKRRVLSSGLLPAQLEPLQQRLDTLESFMPSQEVEPTAGKKKSKAKPRSLGSDWTPKSSQLTIVDLSCPCISPDTASSLFNICFGIFMEQTTQVGRIVALDEAHKYMNNSAEARRFTDTLLSTVRLQRHLGVRVVISTQEPTISSDLLSLCSVVIVHRFSSPAWLRSLKSHVAAVALDEQTPEEGGECGDNTTGNSNISKGIPMFNRIVHLRVGEALLFSPSAVLGIPAKDSSPSKIKRLGAGYFVVKIRERITEDGGKSVVSS